jgi:magnesium transporter|tara:strand:- start:200 stop:1543 length:1344 start_codon:yes stop_codon:yes gene_type:complete
MDINELNTKFEKEDIDSLDSGGISFQLSLDETPELVSKNSDIEVNQALSEQMIEDLTIDELKSVIGQLNLKKHDSDKGLINVDQLASVLNEAPPELAAEVLRGIDWYHASQVISKIRDMEGVGKLYKYQKPSDDFMKHDFVAIRSAWSVSHTVSVLRKSNISSNKLQNLFVVDAKGKLVGSINISDLIFANLTQSVSEVMKPNIISVTADVDKKECANIMDKHGLRALAVTNEDGILDGVISIEEVVHLVEQEATKDMFNMVGMSIDDKVIGPIKNSFKRRLPWLIINLGTVLFAGFILSLFTNHVRQMPVLAVFLPVIIGQAGIAGTQTLTLVVRALALGEVTTKDTRNILNRELFLSVIQGLLVTLLLFIVIYVWKSDFNLAALVGGAMLLNLFVAGLMGVIVPIFMKTVNLDPASSSAVIVTTFTDIAGVLVYMGLASLIIFGI